MAEATIPAEGAAPEPGGAASVTYDDDLAPLDWLATQKPLSGQHDEMRFIVIHQASELWLTLSAQELTDALRPIRGDDLAPACTMPSRINRIQSHRIQAWEILATMMPFDDAQCRASLGARSGVQSHQYRAFECLLGAKNPRLVASHCGEPIIYAELGAVLQAPSLYEETLRLLARRGFAIPAGHLDRDSSQPSVPDPSVEAAWLTIDRQAERWWSLYALGEKLVDLEYRLQHWRFAHLKTVGRIIGFKRGTGGSDGVAYLAKTLERRPFPELMSLRTVI